MLKPFIILALPRTGTTMLTSAIGSHPQIEYCAHEFKGTEKGFWAHPYVLSNYLKDWMLDDSIELIHLYREDSIAGARSMLLMNYNFPDNVATLPADEVLEMAHNREKWDAQFASVTDWSVSYESICEHKEVVDLPSWFSNKFCDRVGVTRHTLTTCVQKGQQLLLKNQDQIACLSA